MHKIKNFQLMAKPSGSVCNINCSYCYYLEKERLYPDRKNRWKMDGHTLEQYVRKTIQAQSAPVVDFIWQGGEPTLLGIDFFRQAVHLQALYRGDKQINNFFQTNGTNLTEKWAIFLKKHHFLVGISLDGNRAHNDAWRLTRAGKSTFDSVLKGIKALQRHNVEFNTLTVVNAENVKQPLEVYRFLKRSGSRYMQFIPLVERRASLPDKQGLTLIPPDFSGQCQVAGWSVPAKAYGRFLNAIFNHWITHDLGTVFVMNFEQTMAKMLGQQSACVINETCGGNLILEANGDIYSCDHFVYPDYKLGNINKDSLEELVNSPQNQAFGLNKLKNISRECRGCAVRPLCNGGCPKQRFMLSSDGMPNKNYLCDGFSLHLQHVVPVMGYLIELMQKRVAPKQVMAIIRKKFMLK